MCKKSKRFKFVFILHQFSNFVHESLGTCSWDIYKTSFQYASCLQLWTACVHRKKLHLTICTKPRTYRTVLDACVRQWGQIITWNLRGETEKYAGVGGSTQFDFYKNYNFFKSFYGLFIHSHSYNYFKGIPQTLFLRHNKK